jgi:hypothetical protein
MEAAGAAMKTQIPPPAFRKAIVRNDRVAPNETLGAVVTFGRVGGQKFHNELDAIVQIFG